MAQDVILIGLVVALGVLLLVLLPRGLRDYAVLRRDGGPPYRPDGRRPVVDEAARPGARLLLVLAGVSRGGRRRR